MKNLVVLILLLIPFVAFPQLREKRAVNLLGGIAVNDGAAGYHLEAAGGFQGKSFGFGIYSALLSNPSIEFTNWTIIGLQTKFLFGEGLRPYGLFDFGLFNFQTIRDDLNLRTASLDLGVGVDKPMRSGNALLFDVRWRWLVDYAGEWDARRVLTVGIGIRF